MRNQKITELIPIEHYVCLRCGHKWIPRLEDKPRVCPGCKSPYWDIPKKANNNQEIEVKHD